MGINMDWNLSVEGIGSRGADDERDTILIHNYLDSIADVQSSVYGVNGSLVGELSAASAFTDGYYASGVHTPTGVASAVVTFAGTRSSLEGALEFYWTPAFTSAIADNADILAIGSAAGADKMCLYYDGANSLFAFKVYAASAASASAGISAAASAFGFGASATPYFMAISFHSTGDLRIRNTWLRGVTMAISNSSGIVSQGTATWTPGLMNGVYIGSCGNIGAVNGGSNAAIENIKYWKTPKAFFSPTTQAITPR